MKSIYLSICLGIVAHQAFAQHSSFAYRHLADSLFEHHNYQHAAEYYEKALKKAEHPGYIMLRIAKCYSKMNKVNEAGHWYEKSLTNHASFDSQDMHDYVQLLLKQQKRREAEVVLRKLLADNPDNLSANEILDDLTHYEKYFQDSALVSVKTLSINTPDAEFAPAYYKDGIVFTASTQTAKFSKKKYHWDNSNFLNLFYSVKVDDQNFLKPVLFEKELDSRYHDGPAVFYSHDEKMIVNRNIAAPSLDKKDTWIWHLSLYDASRSSENNAWLLTSLPFDQPPYSLAHPSISEDGSVLYFVSDKPGGYGGTDIYRVDRKNGTWGKPVNLGPSVNTPGDEVFPFFTGNTLYFASDGHGGLGGLDIFKCTRTVNGFSPPVNLGFPINSSVDDFSLITKGDEREGYFASSRNGNDDLFFFSRRPQMVKMLAYTFDGTTKNPLPGVDVRMITSSNEDRELVSDEDGYIHFDLSRESAYVLIASKADKGGMVTGFALPQEDYHHIMHRIPLYGDTTSITCVGKIENEFGVPENPASITITDENTGDTINFDHEKSLITFRGEKNHNYRVEVKNTQGDSSTHHVAIDADEHGTLTWNMVLKKSEIIMNMAAHVFNAADSQALGRAKIKIITFSEADQEHIADENGVIEFNLVEGTAYVVIGSKDNLTGMHSGIAEVGTDKNSIIHPIPAHGDADNPLAVAALITDKHGNILKNATATITDKSSNKSVSVKLKGGVLNFPGERGKDYIITVTADNYKTVMEEINIPLEAVSVDKISIVLDEELNSPTQYLMAARIFKAEDQSPLAGAHVTVTSLIEPEMELTADDAGQIEFILPGGSAYVIIAGKDGYYGMHTGIAEEGMDKSSVIHPVPTDKEHEKMVPVVAWLSDAEENEISEEDVTVTENTSGEIVPTQLNNGLLNFFGEKGEGYTITLIDKNQNALTKEIIIPTDGSDSDIVSVSLVGEAIAKSRKRNAGQIPVVARITDQQGGVVLDAVVVVAEKVSGEKTPSLYQNGLLNFSGEKGKEYIISVRDSQNHILNKEISIPITDAAFEKISITLDEAGPSTYQIAARVFKADDNLALGGAKVTVSSFTEEDIELTTDDQGHVEFTLPGGSAYVIFASKDEYGGMHSGMAEKGTDKASIIHPIPANRLQANVVAVMAVLINENGEPSDLSHVMVTEKSAGDVVPSNLKDGILTFYGKKGETYVVSESDQDYHNLLQEVTIPLESGGMQRISITVEDNLSLANVPPGYTVTVNVFKADDRSPLGNANVKILSFSEPDQDLAADTSGTVSFQLAEGTAYVAIGSKDGYTGMHSGVVENTSANTYPIPAYSDDENQVPVIAVIRDEQGKSHYPLSVEVVNNATGETIPFKKEKGILTFMGEKGSTYSIHIDSDKYGLQKSNISLDPHSSDVKPFEIKLTSARPALTSVSTLIILNSDGPNTRFYITESDRYAEVVEQDGTLFTQHGAESKVIGKGSLRELRDDPSSVMQALGLSSGEVISLQNIYFDYNKSNLDETDKNELDKATAFLKNHVALHLEIGAHADDRGSDKYNLNLSKRRARSIKDYLVKQGVLADHIHTEGYGESLPAVPCSGKCNEEEYQKNRRAEFILRIANQSERQEVIASIISKKEPAPTKNHSWLEILKKYGDVQKDGLEFKISIGAYRFNHTLTFDALKDLGTVQSMHANGTTYYYLTSFTTLNEAERVRQEVANRKVNDAFISIFLNGKNITVKEMLEKL